MKYKNLEIINIYQILNSFSGMKFPQKIAYAIIKNMKILQFDVDTYNTSFHSLEDKYIDDIEKDEHGEIKRVENGSPIFKSTEKIEEFFAEYEELANIEIDINLYHIDEELFNYDDNNGKYDVLAPKDIIILQSILCEEENDKQNEENEDK